jgi:hypothetical protein
MIRWQRGRTSEKVSDSSDTDVPSSDKNLVFADLIREVSALEAYTEVLFREIDSFKDQTKRVEE